MHIAETVVALRSEGLLDDDPVFAAEHLDAIIVHRDPRLHAAFQAQLLAPLDSLAPAARERLTETLTSWLRHFGDRQAVSAELHIHPQTVRYRMTQLHDLLGDLLDDPMGRARLTLALVWSRTPGQSRSSAAGAPAAAVSVVGTAPAALSSASTRRTASTKGSASPPSSDPASLAGPAPFGDAVVPPGEAPPPFRPGRSGHGRSARSTKDGSTVIPRQRVPSQPITPTATGARRAKGNTG
jgi:hypothetical protein